MKIPRNCKECMFGSSCYSWYGGTNCLYKPSPGTTGATQEENPDQRLAQFVQDLNPKMPRFGGASHKYIHGGFPKWKFGKSNVC